MPLDLFTGLPLETVWKIAKGLLERVYWKHKDAKRGFFMPVFVVRSPQDLGSREFPNSFRRLILGNYSALQWYWAAWYMAHGCLLETGPRGQPRNTVTHAILKRKTPGPTAVQSAIGYTASIPVSSSVDLLLVPHPLLLPQDVLLDL